MSQVDSRKWYHDIRSSLNGVICMGSLLEETELTEDQRELLTFMIRSANKSVELLEACRSETNNGLAVEIPSAKDSPFITEPSSRILVAEDDDINRLYLSTILKRRNWEVDEAVDGLQAVELCRRNSYRIILMDVSMPGLDGFQAARQIRASGNNTPIIAITAHSLQDLQDRLSDIGVDQILRKPFNEEELLKSVLKLVGDIHHAS